MKDASTVSKTQVEERLEAASAELRSWSERARKAEQSNARLTRVNGQLTERVAQIEDELSEARARAPLPEHVQRTVEQRERRLADLEAENEALKGELAGLRTELAQLRDLPGAVQHSHELKTWPQYFEPIQRGLLTGCVRNNDRNFKPGDVVLLREWSVDTGYTGRRLLRRITHVLTEINGIDPRYAGLSFGLVEVQ